MIIYRKLASRVVMLGTLVIAAAMLLQPTRAAAFTCLSDCFDAYQNCVSQGELGCDEVYIQCINDCN